MESEEVLKSGKMYPESLIKEYAKKHRSLIHVNPENGVISNRFKVHATTLTLSTPQVKTFTLNGYDSKGERIYKCN